ncbi:hypothetical protein MPH_12742 [Macrophomina phaseolina MS6]|uniref:Uncharacterized protein n=1 Tax=Macrophomina phaseolina (strain MS6) TaxID=1126212 RepID=K2RBB6_MACPH|nr:hypothetical protein MPH_12742 [Macrophomina phaseolina MS6]
MKSRMVLACHALQAPSLAHARPFAEQSQIVSAAVASLRRRTKQPSWRPSEPALGDLIPGSHAVKKFANGVTSLALAEDTHDQLSIFPALFRCVAKDTQRNTDGKGRRIRAPDAHFFLEEIRSRTGNLPSIHAFVEPRRQELRFHAILVRQGQGPRHKHARHPVQVYDVGDSDVSSVCHVGEAVEVQVCNGVDVENPFRELHVQRPAAL